MTAGPGSCHTCVVTIKPPPVPVPAATVVLLRDRAGGGVDLLLIRRHSASKFAAGDHVFPGGKISAADTPPDAVQWCRGLDLEEASRRLGLAPDVALAHWVGAIRETFEEVGLLLAYDERGEPMRVDAPRFADYRAECQASSHAFWDMVRAERLTLATERLMYFAHWITPEEQPLRFDTRFFAAAMLPGQEAVADLKEITEVRWLEPPEALAAARRAEISLRNATARNVELFVGATSARDAVERVAGREIRTIRPRVVLENGQRRVLMPDDPDWY